MPASEGRQPVKPRGWCRGRGVRLTGGLSARHALTLMLNLAARVPSVKVTYAVIM